MEFWIYEFNEYEGREYHVKTVGTVEELRDYFNKNSKGWPCGILPTNYWWLHFRMKKKQ